MPWEFDLGQSASVFRDVEESRWRPSVVNIADPSDEDVSDTEREEVRPRQRLRLTWNSSGAVFFPMLHRCIFMRGS